MYLRAPSKDYTPLAGVAQLVEHYLAKVDVASSNLVSRSNNSADLDQVCAFPLVLLSWSYSVFWVSRARCKPCS